MNKNILFFLTLSTCYSLYGQLSIYGREFSTGMSKMYDLEDNSNRRITFALSTLGNYVLIIKGAGLGHETGQYEVRGDTLLLVPDIVKILDRSSRSSTDSILRIKIYDGSLACIYVNFLEVYTRDDILIIDGNEDGMFYIQKQVYNLADSIIYKCASSLRFDIKKLNYDLNEFNLRLRVFESYDYFIRSQTRAIRTDEFVILRGDTLFRLNYDVAH